MKKYEDLYSIMERSPTLARIWEEAYGEDYPAEAAPYGFVTVTDLLRMVRDLHLEPGQLLIDLGCGRGGPGLWVARACGARLIGIDNSPAGVAQAGRRARAFGLHQRAVFRVGDAAATALQPWCADGVMSVDAFGAFGDKAAAAREIARILRPGGRLVCTLWDSIKPRDPQSTSQPMDERFYRSILHHAGLVVDAYEETPDWKRRQLAVYSTVQREHARLREEMGEALQHVLEEADMTGPNLALSRRVYVAAHRV